MSGRRTMTEKRTKEDSSKSSKSTKEASFHQQFKVGKRIGAGSFGTLRLGLVVATNEKVAIKLEPNKKGSTLPLEYKMYRMVGNTEGVPKVYYFGPCGKFNALVLELLGPSLEKMFQVSNKKFSLKTVIQLALQILRRIEFVHSRGVVYRDIKPENFLLGPKDSRKANTVHIIDFGLAKSFIDRKTRKHIPFKERRSHTGTARYMSLNTHMGREQSRRDDLEAIGYMIIYFLRGSLPWQGLPVKGSDARLQAIHDCKKTTEVTRLCDGLPPELVNYINYVRGLDFYETPRYDHLRSLFIAVFERERFVDDGLYDWNREESKDIISKESTGNYRMIDEFRNLTPCVDPTNVVEVLEDKKHKRKQATE